MHMRVYVCISPVSIFPFFGQYLDLNSRPCTTSVVHSFLLLGYFSDRISHFLPYLASDHNPPTYSLASSWDHSCVPPPLAYWLKWRSH
jgi:hypothetical protein